MPAFVIPFLKGILPFLWRYKFAILAAAVAWFVWSQHSTIQDLEKDKTALQTANKQYAATLKTVRESAAKQIAALEAETIDAAERNKKLSGVLEGVQNNNETVNCPMPNFMRNAFERM